MKPADLFDLIFARERRPSGKDVWAQEQPGIAGPLEREEMVRLGWDEEKATRQETLPLQGKARKHVFAKLPDEERDKYIDIAAAWKPYSPST